MLARVVAFSAASVAAAEFTKVVEETALRDRSGCIATLVQIRGQAVMEVSIWESASAAEHYSSECYSDLQRMLRPYLKCDSKLYTFDAPGTNRSNIRPRAALSRTTDSFRYARAGVFATTRSYAFSSRRRSSSTS